MIPGLWIGDIKSSRDNNLFRKSNIKCVINCENDFKYLLNEYNQYDINLIKKESNLIKTFNYFNQVSEFINNNLKECKNILIFCNTGNQFSPTIGIIYLIKYGKIDKISAINFMLSKNENIFRDKIFLNTAIDFFCKKL